MARHEDLSDFESGFTVVAQMAGASVTKTAQLASVSIGTVTKVTSAFRSMGKTSLNTYGEILDRCVLHHHHHQNTK